MRIKRTIGSVDGIDIPQFCGGDGEGDEQQQSNNGSEAPDDNGNDEDDDDDDGDEEDQRVRKLSRENNKRRLENRKLKKELQELQDAQEREELAKKSKVDRATKQLETATQANDRLTSTNKRLLLENAGLKDSSNSWHDAEAVIALLDTSVIDVDVESGRIDGIEEALKDLAQDKPYLVKAAESQGRGNGPSGNQPGAGSSSKKMTAEQKRNAIADKWKFPSR